MANEKLFYVGVKGLIKNKDGQILLLHADVTRHRKNTAPYWDIPGGRIQEGYGVIETLRREIEEETGVNKLQNIEFLTSVVSHHQIPLPDGTNAGLVLMVYTLEIPENNKIVISEEHTDYAWFDAKDAAKHLSNKYPKDFTDALIGDDEGVAN